jgi:hypothetical protein
MKSLQTYLVETLGQSKNIKPGLDKFCRKLSATAERIPVDKLFEIFGETYQDQPRKPDSWLRVGTGWFTDDANCANVLGYLCYDNNGDYVGFLKKPSKSQLIKATEYVQQELLKLLDSADKKFWDKYDPKLKVVIRDYNPYYQPKDTYGIGIDIKFK